jgi:hypothetical protein
MVSVIASSRLFGAAAVKPTVTGVNLACKMPGCGRWDALASIFDIVYQNEEATKHRRRQAVVLRNQ